MAETLSLRRIDLHVHVQEELALQRQMLGKLLSILLREQGRIQDFRIGGVVNGGGGGGEGVLSTFGRFNERGCRGGCCPLSADSPSGGGGGGRVLSAFGRFNDLEGGGGGGGHSIYIWRFSEQPVVYRWRKHLETCLLNSLQK